jgi:hypothetical protein
MIHVVELAADLVVDSAAAAVAEETVTKSKPIKKISL